MELSRAKKGPLLSPTRSHTSKDRHGLIGMSHEVEEQDFVVEEKEKAKELHDSSSVDASTNNLLQ